jgi:predicted HD phosphohydrolase
MASVSYTRMADRTELTSELDRFQGALKVTRLEHSLQSATRAYRAGKDKECVAALGDTGRGGSPNPGADCDYVCSSAAAGVVAAARAGVARAGSLHHASALGAGWAELKALQLRRHGRRFVGKG